MDLKKEISRRKFIKYSGVTMGVLAGGSIIPVPSFAEEKLLNTIGIGVTVQDRFLSEFTKRTGVKIKGTLSTLEGAQNKMITGGAKIYDVNETIANRLKPQWEAGVLQPIPVKRIANWKYARTTFTQKGLAPANQLYTDETYQKMIMVPIVYNFDSIGYNPSKVGEITSRAALFDPKYAGKCAIVNESIFSPAGVALYLMGQGLLRPKKGPGNLTKDEFDYLINFLIQKKKEGQFRAIWTSYGELVNLLASGEVYISDAWEPAVMDVKRQGIPCKYATLKEGYVGWVMGIVISKFTSQVENCYKYIDFWLEGWAGAQVADQGYYSPVSTLKKYLTEKEYDHWYNGVERDIGSLELKEKNCGVWISFPDEYQHYVQRWNEFLNA